jgi:hypothetical protein
MCVRVDIGEATQSYERWLAERVPLVRRDLDLKHRLMSEDVFSFLRATPGAMPKAV